jgi:hypothetical protein
LYFPKEKKFDTIKPSKTRFQFQHDSDPLLLTGKANGIASIAQLNSGCHRIRTMKTKTNSSGYIRSAAAALVIMLLSLAATASAAQLTGTLGQLVARWETSDPNLSTLLSLHIANRAGDPVVVIRLANSTAASQVLPALSAAGFRLTSTSRIDARLLEGYLPLRSARAVAAVPGVAIIRAQLKPKSNAGSVQSQAVALEKADKVQQTGINGSGTRIGALSDSFDACADCSTHAAQKVERCCS